VADAAVLDPDHLGALSTYLLHGGRYVRHPKRNAGRVRLERLSVSLGIPERERDVRGLDLTLGELAHREPEHVPIPRDRPRGVPRRHRHEVDLFDLHHGSLPSSNGA
jgi:hypothetical protein